MRKRKKSCNNCYCYIVCRVIQEETIKRFSEFRSLDELKKLWRELGSTCQYFLDKGEVARLYFIRT